MKLKLPLLLLCLATAMTTASARQYGDTDTRDPKTAIPKGIVPEFDYWIRDTWVTLAPDGYYYLTGTTATPGRVFEFATHCWDYNDGLYLWRSKDLNNWEAMGLIWALDDESIWQSVPKVHNDGKERRSVNGDLLEDNFRAVWAPEMHYIKSQKNWFIVACMNDSGSGPGSFILRSTTGRPEGPYVNIEANEDGPIFPNIDGSLYEEEDGTVYFVGHNHYIARMKPDMSGFDEELKTLGERKYEPEPYIEGAFIFKHDDKYHLVQAIWSHRLPSGDTYIEKEGASRETRYSYDCVIATADNIYGPYSERYNAITGGGHNNLLQDKDGGWWATMFYNPRGAQAREYEKTCRPGLVPMKYEGGKFMPDPSRVKK